MVRRPGYVSCMSTEKFPGWAVVAGVGLPVIAFIRSWGWMRDSADLTELVARAVAIGSVMVAVGAFAQAGRYPDPAPTFWGRVGAYLAASGAMYVAAFSLLGVLVPGFVG